MQKTMKIYDTSLRDGTQSADINYTVKDKLEIAGILDDFGVDYIELGWPGSNPKDMECFLEIDKRKLKHSKVAAFGSTRRKGIKASEDNNLLAIIKSKAKTATIFGKTWLEHVRKQLGFTPEENLDAIRESISFLKNNGLEVFYDAEHFFDGYLDDRDYALKCVSTAYEAGADCIILCDTNGGILPSDALRIVREVNNFFSDKNIDASLGVHFHNDSDCAVSNTLIVSEYISQIQGTINGVGERAGNANLCSILPALKLKMGYSVNADLRKLTNVSDRFNLLSNIKIRNDQPYVGRSAFSHKGGIHVDALMKGATYEAINPEDVGNKRQIVLSDLSGSANIIETARKFGFKVDKKDKGVYSMLEEVKELEKKGYRINDIDAEQFLLSVKHFGDYKSFFEIEDLKIISEVRDGKDYNECVLVGSVDGKNRETVFPVKGGKGGPVDATYKCLQKMLATIYKEIRNVNLVNYKVMIFEDKGHESSVRVYIGFKNHKDEWAATGVNTNILKASLEAIKKGFRYYLLRHVKD